MNPDIAFPVMALIAVGLMGFVGLILWAETATPSWLRPERPKYRIRREMTSRGLFRWWVEERGFLWGWNKVDFWLSLEDAERHIRSLADNRVILYASNGRLVP